jgi:hypothetical protein
MKLRRKARPRARLVLLAAGCIAVGVLAGPGIAGAAQNVVQSVLVTNTASNPVPVQTQGTIPVASQGTTQVAGTVTVANQPTPPAPEPKPVSIQRRFTGSIDDANHGAFSQIVYQVPEGKQLTVEYVQIYTIKPYEANGVSFSVACGGTDDGANVQDAVYQQPELASSKTWRLYGGPMTLVVPGGNCLVARLHVLEADIPSNIGLGVNGAMTGLLTDEPGT